MKTHLANAAWGVLDYAAYPIGMLAVAPMLLHNLGATRYGIWTVATAVVSAGSILASGFGDANIQHVASIRGARIHRDLKGSALLNVVRGLMGINLILGLCFAAIGWLLSGVIAERVVGPDVSLQHDCLWALRTASILMLVRSIESVCISTQRAFERYGSAVRVSIYARLLGLASAALLSYFSQRITALFASTACLMLLALAIQLIRLKSLLSAPSLIPVFQRDAMWALIGFGTYSWLQALSGVVFSQADRLVIGVSLGAASVSAYALCAQMTQPICGFAASGLHFLFPYLSNRNAEPGATSLRRPLVIAFLANLVFVMLSSFALMLFGPRLLFAWGGKEIAQRAIPLLPMLAWSSALLGLNVTGNYALMALGKIRVATSINLAGGLLMLSLMYTLSPWFGIRGVVIAKLVYACTTLLVYIPLLLHSRAKKDSHFASASLRATCEES